MTKLINNYYDLERSAVAVKNNTHRTLVGGLWEEIGGLQFNFLVENGLEPDKKILDIGCGCLRVGVHIVKYLDSGNYYGSDLSQDLLDVGFDVELGNLGLQHKLPKSQLLCESEFRFEKLNASFDFALALSVFTHLPLNQIRLCIERLTPVMAEGGLFFATFFICEEGQDWAKSITQTDEVVTHPDSDPYHYRESDIEYCIGGLPWEAEIVGDWNHPRNQKMIIFKRKRHISLADRIKKSYRAFML